MPKITRVEIFQVDLKPKVARSDAIQSFSMQETPMLRVFCDDGSEGTGYSYTIGNGGSSVTALLRDHLAPRLLGKDADMVEEIWKDLYFFTHATSVGAITSIALSVVDTALWDRRCRAAALPLHVMAGGAQRRVAVYDTEGGWLHLKPGEVVENALAAKAKGFRGVKIKIGRPHVSEDVTRLAAVRKALGPAFDIMTDANQGFTVSEAIRRARHYAALDVLWFEEPLPAEDLDGHVLLSQSTSVPIAVGESLYHPSHFREYLQRGACNIIQVDVGRVGGITPWLKVAHLAETFNVQVCPHYLMEIHLGLCCAVPNATWLEHIPQLDDITVSRIAIKDGYALASPQPGLGIEWDWKAIERRRTAPPDVVAVSRRQPKPTSAMRR
ncbi:MAG TPA: mandelate racemase/muconate lactonizing enzyme family protein [Burkholderiales bacterium]|nr:mandelate racemase/muconate lactonizing enzyme family protein [Burkholderiales bacterium]